MKLFFALESLGMQSEELDQVIDFNAQPNQFKYSVELLTAGKRYKVQINLNQSVEFWNPIL